MKANWKAIGITVAVAGALVYPAMKLYEYIAKKRAEGSEEEEEHPLKHLGIVHHSKHAPHRRAAHNGHVKA